MKVIERSEEKPCELLVSVKKFKMSIPNPSEASNEVIQEEQGLMVGTRRSQDRPCYKLSARLIETYKNINKVGFTNLIAFPSISLDLL